MTSVMADRHKSVMADRRKLGLQAFAKMCYHCCKTGKNRCIRMKISNFSSKYQVKKLDSGDLEKILKLCISNPQFYVYHPPLVTRESILEDIAALPSGKEASEKYYIGFWDGDSLVAVMDLIENWPQEKVAYIGFFMVAAFYSGRGIGTGIIEEIALTLAEEGFVRMRLAIDQGNPQSEAFWLKNGFKETGKVSQRENLVHILMERQLNMHLHKTCDVK